MRIVAFVEIIKILLNKLFTQTNIYHFSRLGLIILFVASLVLTLGIPGYTEMPILMPEAAVIQDFDGSGNHFWISRSGDERQEFITKIPNIRQGNGRIENGGKLSVPTDGKAWASLYFVGEETYQGLIVKTRLMKSASGANIYTFRCRFKGAYIIAWKQDEDTRFCDAEDGRITGKDDGGIKIVTDSGNIPHDSSKFEVNKGVAVGFNNKQNSPQRGIKDLEVKPGSGQTVIRTTSSPSNTSFIEYPLERCTPEETARGEGAWCRRERKVTVENETVSIEVLEGEILVKSEENTEGTKVQKGQKYFYSYPAGEITSINSAEEANTCEMLKFLNAAYWSSPDTPKSISDEIAEQLKRHREALGVSGRPPSNLSTLERSVFEEINFARANPSNYADLLEKQKQYFYSNYLKPPGETVDPNSRVLAVDETVDFLRHQRTLPPVSISTGMSRANQDHVNDQGKSGKYFGHTGEDISGTGARLRRYGSVGCAKYDEDEFENIVYFEPSTDQSVLSTHRAVVMEMLIPERPRLTGNRDNLFNKDFQVTGVACGSHGDSIHKMCVITYSEGYKEL
ncbi:MAG: CAP domain-containing protein [Symploca sp. SIO1C4]|uniref:CAP domain-containing protein n=1 Tax=Symploca sp. SIO1C4 TaxID=2607765 RepID=A0A6B3N4D5_9CYAN|nr:CAP domain-containing protein [Symploca sp. SIO1C4]